MRPGQSLDEIGRDRAAQVGAVGGHAGEALALEHVGEAPDSGFDFGQFGHARIVARLATIR